MRGRSATGALPPAMDFARLIGQRGAQALVVEGIGIRFVGIRAAEGVSVRAEAGAVTSLIGPNGAGKTTVLNMISGFYRPQAGAIRLGERDLARAPAHVIARAGIARATPVTSNG